MFTMYAYQSMEDLLDQKETWERLSLFDLIKGFSQHQKSNLFLNEELLKHMYMEQPADGHGFSHLVSSHHIAGCYCKAETLLSTA